MEFSVVITTHNRLNLLQRAINSALYQTLECEVVVVDDCSSDGTKEYVENLIAELEEIHVSRLVYLRNQQNMGHAVSVNVGVQKAKGDWVKFLDDDDYLAANCLAEMLKAISLRADEAVICSCIAAQVDTEEVEISRTPQLGPGLAFYVPQADVHYGMLLELIPFGTPAQVACKRDTFLKTGGWDPSLDTNCDDIDSWIQVAQFGDAIFLNQCLAYRTIWPGAYNQKFSFSQRLATNILMKEKIYALVDRQHDQDIPKLDDVKNYLKLHWILVALKQKNIKGSLDMIEPSMLSPATWQLFFKVIFARKIKIVRGIIRKLVLIEKSEI